MFPVAFSTVETGKVEGNKGGGDKKKPEAAWEERQPREEDNLLGYSVAVFDFYFNKRSHRE